MRGRVRAISVLVMAISVYVPTRAEAAPSGRFYEMVSPVYKGGYGVEAVGNFPGIDAVAPDGDGVVFFSKGAFAGTPSEPPFQGYLARRGAQGWSTVPLTPPATIAPWTGTTDPTDFSPALDTSISRIKPGASSGSAYWRSDEAAILLHRTDLPDMAPNPPQPGPYFEVAGRMLKTVNGEALSNLTYQGADVGLCHILVQATPSEPLVPEATGLNWPAVTYDVGTGCEEAPSPQMVGLDNRDRPIATDCNANFVGGSPLAAAGRELFFEACAPGGTRSRQLFTRLAGQRTLEVSRPIEAQCIGAEPPHITGEVPCADATTRAPAIFGGASLDGSKVFFTTAARLEPAEDNDNANDLYMATIGCPTASLGCAVAERVVTSLSQISHDPNGGLPAVVRGVVAVSHDGTRAYFVARGSLLTQSAAEALEAGGRSAPVVGAENLYVYDTATKSISFVADLCSGPEASGEVEDIRCPQDLEEGSGGRNDILLTSGQPEAQLADPAGSFLVFSSYARLSTNDTDNSKDIYRYDARGGALVRVSLGQAGYDANGNGVGDASISPSSFSASDLRDQYMEGNRAITEDGSGVVFTTKEPLSPDAVNGLPNVYEWHDGAVSLVSSGHSSTPTTEILITPSGEDVFFATTEGLLPQDTDGVRDVYDARLPHVAGEEVAFPLPAAKRRPCEADACQGPLTNPAPLLVPGSTMQTAGENVSPKKRAASRIRHKARRSCGRHVKKKPERICRNAGGRRRHASRRRHTAIKKGSR